jgi:hypothetical protein
METQLFLIAIHRHLSSVLPLHVYIEIGEEIVNNKWKGENKTGYDQFKGRVDWFGLNQ